MFADSATNPHQSQLIFTTNDVSLISRSAEGERTTLDRDQIWFTEKNACGESTLFTRSLKSSRAQERTLAGTIRMACMGLLIALCSIRHLQRLLQ